MINLIETCKDIEKDCAREDLHSVKLKISRLRDGLESKKKALENLTILLDGINKVIKGLKT